MPRSLDDWRRSEATALPGWIKPQLTKLVDQAPDGRVTRALGELRQARQELDDATGLAGGSVAVAAETLRILTGLAAEFLAEHPEVSLRLNQCSTPVMADQLRAGEIDLCLASQPMDAPSLHAKELSEKTSFSPFRQPTALPVANRSRSKTLLASRSSRPGPAIGSERSPIICSRERG